MHEVTIEHLHPDYIFYIKENIGVSKYVGGQKLWYCKNACHVNSILFGDFIKETTPYSCSIIEGIVICKDGLAYGHQWNLIRDENSGESQYVDVTMDAIASDEEREAEKTYYELIEHTQEDMISKIANREPLFSKETHDAINAYYKEHPEREAYYREGKRFVDNKQ